MTLNYYDYEETIKTFLSSSINNAWEEFDFDQAFESFKEPINRKLAEHGLLTYEEFRDYHEEIEDYSCLEGLEQNTDYIQISKEDLKEAIIKYKYERNKEVFENNGIFADLIELLQEIDQVQTSNRTCCILLFDKLIHAQHETGNIFDDVDIEAIKEEIDKEAMIYE